MPPRPTRSMQLTFTATEGGGVADSAVVIPPLFSLETPTSAISPNSTAKATLASMPFLLHPLVYPVLIFPSFYPHPFFRPCIRNRPHQIEICLLDIASKTFPTPFCPFSKETFVFFFISSFTSRTSGRAPRSFPFHRRRQSFYATPLMPAPYPRRYAPFPRTSPPGSPPTGPWESKRLFRYCWSPPGGRKHGVPRSRRKWASISTVTTRVLPSSAWRSLTHPPTKRLFPSTKPHFPPELVLGLPLRCYRSCCYRRGNCLACWHRVFQARGEVRPLLGAGAVAFESKGARARPRARATRVYRAAWNPPRMDDRCLLTLKLAPMLPCTRKASGAETGMGKHSLLLLLLEAIALALQARSLREMTASLSLPRRPDRASLDLLEDTDCASIGGRGKRRRTNLTKRTTGQELSVSLQLNYVRFSIQVCFFRENIVSIHFSSLMSTYCLFEFQAETLNNYF